MAKIEVENLFKIFGPANKIEEALQLCQEGKPAGEVSEETGCTAAVYDVTFNVEGAVIFVIMGLSGSGKSTLMRCVNRLIEPTAGKVLIDDENVLDLDHKSILKLREKKMSMVFQHFGLMPHKTVLENAVFGLELSGVAADERDKKGRETLEMVGLEDYADSEVGELSGGMQQRVGLARALATDAEILLMDEAFSALDPLIHTEMQEELLELQKKLPKTILFITHDLGEALMLGDKIAIMKSGEVVQIGTPEEIVLNPENEYVASFVENVDRSRVLTVETAVGDTQPVIDLSDSVRKAIDTMGDQGIEFLLVLEDERPEGFIRLNDAEKEAEKEDPQLKNIIQPAEVSVKPDDQLIAVLNKITEAQPLLPVMDENGRMKGVLTKDKLLRAIAGGNK